MLHIILFAIILTGLFCLAIFSAGGLAVYGYIQQRKRLESEQLAAYHRRLKSVVSGLLTRADEIDQEHKYAGDSQVPGWSLHLGETCKDLVVLSDALGTIEVHIRRREVREGRAMLLRSCRIAVKLSRQLGEIQRSARAISGVRIKLPTEDPGT